MKIPLIKKEFFLSLKLSTPLVAALLAQATMELVNSLMLGQLGPQALAAGVLENAIFVMVLITCVGLLNAGGVLIARHYGARQSHEITMVLSQLIYIASFLAIVGMVVLWFVPHFLLWMKQDPEIVFLTGLFLHAKLWGLLPLFLFFSFREFVSALSYTKLIMLLSLMIVPLTALANYIFMFGKWGFPEMGIQGIGYSTALMQWVLLFAILFYIFKNQKLKPYLQSGLQPLLWSKILEIFKLGIPVSLTMGFEVGLFSVTTIMMGYFGTNALAAHQIAMQCATFAFMFPLGIAQGTAIRVGQSIGEGSLLKAKYAGYVGVSLGIIIAVITAVICLSFPTILIGLFINVDEPNHAILISSAVKFLGVMALFQILDAVQVIMNGALRGLKDTFVPMCLGLLSYWISGLTSGYLLAFVYGLGGVGLWWGLGIGIGISGMLLVFRFKQRVLREESILALASPVSA